MNVVPGRYRVNTIELVSGLYGNDGRTDIISGIVGEINIYENMFNNVVTGNVVISENENLPSNFPIVGHENILIDMVNPDVELETGEGHMKAEYKIYNISQRTEDAEGVSSYLLNFQSEEIFTNLKTSVSKAYTGSTISSYVKSIYDEYLDTDKDIDIELTKNNYNFVIPNWKPFHTINWMAQRAIGEDKNGANYLFFENRNGFVFTSLERYYGGAVKETYYYRDVGTLDPDGVGVDDAHRYISNYHINTGFNILENIPLGMYASRLVVHDITLKKVYDVDYSYSDSFGNNTHVDSWGKVLWNSSLDDTVYESQDVNMLVHTDVDGYTKSPKSHQRIVTRHTALYDDGNDNSYLERTVQNRISQIEQLNNFILEFTVPGDFRRNIGDVIYIELPSVEIENKEDGLYSGKYIIIALRHKLDSEQHVMIVTAAKDSYFTPIPA